MAFDSKYSGKELEEKLDSIDNIPSLLALMLSDKHYITVSELDCILTDYAPADYHTIPIDGVTIYWDKGVLKSAGGGGKCLWELKKTESGIEYIYSKYHVLTLYGITMYADDSNGEGEGGGGTLTSFKDIPIDNDTIYWGIKDGKEVLKAKGDSNLFKGHYDDLGNLLYIEALSNLLVDGGITMYNEMDLDLPSLYDGLNIDNDTIYWGYNSYGDKVLKAKVIISEEGNDGLNESQLADYLTRNAYLTTTKGDERYLKLIGGNISGDLTVARYVGIGTSNPSYALDVNGILNVSSYSGIRINGGWLSYNSSGYWKLDGDLIVTGGISFYSSDLNFSPSTIMDGIICDEQTITSQGGILKVIGGTDDKGVKVELISTSDQATEADTLYIIV